MKMLIGALALVCVGPIPGCAHGRVEDLAPDTQMAPREIACAPVTGLRNTVPRISIELRYDVDTDGKVGSVRTVPNLNSKNASDAEISAATSLAYSCLYEPATESGQPVVATMSRWFTVERIGRAR